jgi:DNA uptake protein ComE-like DNA-binding protein
MIHKIIQRIEDEFGIPILDENKQEQYITLSETETPDPEPEPTSSIDINSLTTEQLIELKRKLDSLTIALTDQLFQKS